MTISTLSKVIRLSLTLRVICWLGIIALPLMEAAVWLNADWLKETDAFADLGLSYADLSLLRRVGALAISMVPVLILIYGLWRLVLLFSAYAAGRIFDTETAGHLKAFSICVLLNAIVEIMSTTALTAYLTFDRPEGERMVSVTVSDQEFGVLLMGGLLLVVAWVLGEGAKLADENRQFV
ncbi:DUF2975 domain-containing protein [Aestuariispira ectoiniformans]|uniref:DUF2975 domain-containing protein n=1 Tax=Aestuariispira ectoiniformans TaxID=2775080 RepID=UPI00223AA6AD|nr:DUF2975 domain-containing protein [Aestuariispira ectoiniformans]